MSSPATLYSVACHLQSCFFLLTVPSVFSLVFSLLLYKTSLCAPQSLGLELVNSSCHLVSAFRVGKIIDSATTPVSVVYICIHVV